jgi:RNA polymerase sigma-70 factor (ECF subfamily)
LLDPAQELTDEDLLARLQKGESEWFGPLVKRYQRELYGYLRRYLGDDALAEDVFQNTFLQVYQKLEQFEQGRSVRPWLYAIATHQAIDALRRSARRPSVSLDHAGNGAEPNGEVGPLDWLAADEPEPLANVTAEERRDLVRAGLDTLPESLRSTVLLSYFQGLKYREIAEVLGIPVGTVKSRLHLALSRLQQAWRSQEALTEKP